MAPPLNLFFAVNNDFAMSLAVALQSALQNLTQDQEIRIVVASTGLHAGNQQRIARVASSARVGASIEFVVPDTTSIDALPTSQWHKLPTYLRLLLGDLLPSDWERVIYLDSDVVVRGDLNDLWQRPMANGAIAQGVQDFRNPTVAHRLSLAKAYLADLALSPHTVYCNAGVMVIDLAMWRRENVGRRCIAFVQAHENETEFKDQDGLNGIIADRWDVLPPTWNVALSALHFYGYPNHRAPAYRRKQRLLRRSANVVHFSGPSKPWHHLYRRTLSDEFFDYLMASRWFEPHEAQRWVATRRVAQGALRRVPATWLRMAKAVVHRS
jgi:lipopolysaccharide biosynthesis glycosyltransferase